jgi:hypothetical protein
MPFPENANNVKTVSAEIIAVIKGNTFFPECFIVLIFILINLYSLNSAVMILFHVSDKCKYLMLSGVFISL